ncbi:MAG TPA: hypothetical protein VJO99_11175 [Burkholderiaceae bacterium]|nr:hypothetical protein [Burkholderiaceae bacterium]
MRARTFFQRIVLGRLWVTFLVLGLAFFAFGASSINLVRLLTANLQLLGEHGWQAVMDGALRQLVELIFTGYASVASYVVLKTCEYRLSHWLSDDAGVTSAARPCAPAHPTAPSTRHRAR